MKSITNNIANNQATQVGAVAKVYGVITFPHFFSVEYNYVLVEGIILNQEGNPAPIVSFNSCFKRGLQKIHNV